MKTLHSLAILGAISTLGDFPITYRNWFSDSKPEHRAIDKGPLPAKRRPKPLRRSAAPPAGCPGRFKVISALRVAAA